MRRTALAALTGALCLVGTNGVTAQDRSELRISQSSEELRQSKLRAAYIEREPPYITAKAVKDARGSLKIAMPRKGSFTIKSVKAAPGLPADCKIDRASLVRQVEKLSLTSGITPLSVEIQMKGTPNPGGGTTCKGSGEGCKVILADWDPDDPTLPE